MSLKSAEVNVVHQCLH